MKANRSDTHFYPNYTNGINHTVTDRGNRGGGQEFAAELGIPTRRSIANKAMCNVEIIATFCYKQVSESLASPCMQAFF